jgi:hypothetical protein
MAEPKETTSEIVRAEMSRELALDERAVGANAAAVKARAEVEAPYTIARHFPRSWLDVRTKLMIELDRPAYAKACVFSRIQGKKQDPATGRWVDNVIEGLSIRFAESAMALGGNMRAGKEIQFDDEDKRMFRVFAVDLESNAIREDTIVIAKSVERNKEGAKYRTVVRERTNTAGETVYICEATEDELTLKGNNTAQKSQRNLILALIPPDVKDECLEKAKRIRDAAIAADPHAERKQVADSFAALGVYPAALAEYLGHDLEQCSPAELSLLRGLYMAVHDGEASWADLVAEKVKPEPEQVKTARGKKLAEELRARKAQGVAPPPAAAQAATPPPQGKK